MELGIIGQGRVGTKLVQRLRRAGHRGVVCDLETNAVNMVAKGSAGARSLDDFAERLKKPRAVLRALRLGFGDHEEKDTATAGDAT
jgi:6-phosphogluconate dehydrogenase